MNTRQLFIQDPASKKIRFTRSGVKRYGKKFSLAGYDIKKITTMAEFENAVDASFAVEMQRQANTTKGQNNELDKALDGLPGWD